MFTQKASVGDAPTNSLQAVCGEQPIPSRLPTKETSPNWNPRRPNSSSREGGFGIPYTNYLNTTFSHYALFLTPPCNQITLNKCVVTCGGPPIGN